MLVGYAKLIVVTRASSKYLRSCLDGNIVFRELWVRSRIYVGVMNYLVG